MSRFFTVNIGQLSTLVAIALGLIACTPSKPTSLAKNGADIFSDRPIESTADVFVVTLNSPALLKVSHKTKAGWQVPAASKQQILDEQREFEAKLLALSPESKVVYRYRLVLNGLAIFAKPEIIPQLSALSGVRSIQLSGRMARPEALQTGPGQIQTQDVNSVNFIGADKAHQLGYTGRGMRIGILDTGIDYTHAMLGGSGNPSDYKAIDPNLPSSAFPNKKVVGGIDLVGTDFDAASPIGLKHLPRIDGNPLDEAGHGTHVAGTVAGIGDGRNTYSGVAPDAELYAVKVFGKEGSTMDATVIAAFEFAADPNADLNPDDQLDVVNLSLGGGFGQPHILYSEAIGNLSRAGTVVVASAGNSGPTDYIVGAPSTADDAISIAASVDGSEHNWKFAAVRFQDVTGATWLAKAIEGNVSKPIKDIGFTSGQLVDIGFADSDLTDDVKANLQGQVALIQRGKNPFIEKLRRAEQAGAIGVVVYNNDSGSPIPMGSTEKDAKVAIPAIMISQAQGLKALGDMKNGAVTIEFKTSLKIEEPALIDTITDFSSKGPRSEDNLLKPEIAAPGQRVISAAMGQGTASVEMDGTSMAAPHMTGAMALIKQAHPDLSSAQLKALAMDTAKILNDIPMTLQGAGRVQLDQAVSSPLLVSPGSLSLGRLQIATPRQERRILTLRNLSDETLTLHTVVVSPLGMNVRVPNTVTIQPKSQTQVAVEFDLSVEKMSEFSSELDGRIEFSRNGQIVAQIPALAIRAQATSIRASSDASSLNLTNASPLEGLALPFNLLGEDGRKPSPKNNERWKGRSCDLQSVGYRYVLKADADGKPVEMAQFAFKLYSPVTTWMTCEVSLLIDQDGDGIADQELAGVAAGSVAGVAPAPFFTLLLDARKARELRFDYELKLGQNTPEAPALNYMDAVLSGGAMAPFPQSTLAMIEIPLADLGQGTDGQLHVKAATIGGSDTVESDDFLGQSPLGEWMTLPSSVLAQPYLNLPELINVGQSQARLPLIKGSGQGKLVLYYPMNVLRNPGNDNQSQIF